MGKVTKAEMERLGRDYSSRGLTETEAKNEAERQAAERGGWHPRHGVARAREAAAAGFADAEREAAERGERTWQIGTGISDRQKGAGAMDEQTELLNRIARCVQFAESYEERYRLYSLLRSIAERRVVPDDEVVENTLHDIEEEQGRKLPAR